MIFIYQNKPNILYSGFIKIVRNIKLISKVKSIQGVYYVQTFILYFFFTSQFNIFSQTTNLDSLANTFIDVEDVDQTFYAELDSFKVAIDSYAKNHSADIKLINAMQSWAKIYAVIDPLASMNEYEKSTEIARQINYKRGIAYGKHEIGLLYFKEGFYANAIDYLNRASNLLIDTEEWWEYGFSLIDIGNVYFKLRQFENARKYYKLANQVFITHKFKEKYEFAISVCANNIGLIEMENKNYNKALEFFNDGLSWRKKLNLEEYYGHSFKYFALCYKAMGKLDSANKYYELAIKLDKTKGPKIELIRSYIGMGNLKEEIADYKNAQINFIEAYHTSVEYKMIPLIIESANEMAQFYQIINLKDSAGKYFRIALEYADKYEEMDGRQLACEKLFEIAKTQKNLPNQILYLQELLEIEKQKQVDVVLKKQLEYEVNKRVSDNEILESRNKIQKIIILSVLIILLLLIILLIYILISRKKYIKLNNNLESKNIEINEQKFMLENANRTLGDYSSETLHQKEEIMAQAESLSNALTELKELQKFKEGMAAMIVHDLKNPLNTILNQTKNVIVHESASQMLNMVNNILDLQKYEVTNLPVTCKILPLCPLIENAMYETRYLSEQKNISIINQTSREYAVNADPELIERIIINLLTNAIKYSPLNSYIKISSITVSESFLKISVIDNGPGISENAKERIFEKFTQLISQNSGRTRSTGLGLAFCKMAVEAHHGEIGVDSDETGGAIFWFTLPFSKSHSIKEVVVNEKLNKKLFITDQNYKKLLPYIAELKQTAIYEIAEIRKIIDKIKALGIPNIDEMLYSIENSSYSVNEENYLQMINQLEALNSQTGKNINN